jgi:hypothetical protein
MGQWEERKVREEGEDQERGKIRRSPLALSTEETPSTMAPLPGSWFPLRPKEWPASTHPFLCQFLSLLSQALVPR